MALPILKHCKGKSEGLFFGEEAFFIICAVLCLVAQMFLTLCDSMDCSWPGSSLYGDSPGKNTGVGCHVLLQGAFLPNPGIKPRSSTLWADSLPPKLPGKPMNTGVGSLFLLQGNFLIQEWNQSLPRCKWILYKLNHKGSPRILEWVAYSFSS